MPSIGRLADAAAFIAHAGELDAGLVAGDGRSWRGLRDPVARVQWVGDHVAVGRVT